MVAVVNKAQIVSDEATFVADEGVRMSEKDTGISAYDIMGKQKELEKRYKILEKDFARLKEMYKLDKRLTQGMACRVVTPYKTPRSSLPQLTHSVRYQKSPQN